MDKKKKSSPFQRICQQVAICVFIFLIQILACSSSIEADLFEMLLLETP